MGRPAGVPNKHSRAIKERAAFHGDKALQKIVELIDSDDETVALRAAEALMDRAFGRPAQQQIHVGDEDGGPVRTEKIQREIIDANPANSNGAGLQAVS